MEFSDAHVIVTGGSQGIGLETARLIATRGARVSIVARTEERLAAAAADIESTTGRPVNWVGADVTDPTAVTAGIGELVAESGPCDLLVTCAGLAHPGYFDQLDLDVFRSQMDLVYFGTLHSIRAVLPAMVERGSGGLVGVSSGAGLVGVFGYGAYAPAKYAVRGLMDTLRAEYRHRGLYVACAFPGDTLTPGFEHENTLKPPECAAASAGIAPRSAVDVARAIVRGIEKGRSLITADPTTAALAKGGAPMIAIAERQMAAAVRKATR
ncbi:MAG: SDR family oxidoreductase [Acidimicrobiia bacterium]|nr:SDR family oxidoreductase [Acidimicrobiia bacterium]